MNINKTLLLVVLIAFSNLHAEDLTDIQISAPVLNSQDLTNQAIENINTKNAIDGGDLLRSINGISTIRRGGHGLDPVIRGQSDQRLNSSIDGAIVYGACSSKMDPASTYVNIENYDSITVIKGSVDKGSTKAKYQVDGLSGATITSNGVTNLLSFWLGEMGYGPLIKQIRSMESVDV